MIKTAAILLSRQSMHPHGRMPWVQKALEAVRWIGDNQYHLLTSHEMSTWELLLSIAGMDNIPQTVSVLRHVNDKYARLLNELTEQFGADKTCTEFELVGTYGTNSEKRALMQARDKMIIERADVLIPVSISEGGSMTRLIEHARISGKEIVDRFRVPYEKGSDRFAYRVDETRLTEEIAEIDRDYLVHWTRACNENWPGELKREFYRRVIDSEKFSGSALATLERILDTNRIIASSRNMPGKVPTVSFSGLVPLEVLPLMRWRARYRQMTFEPYGIGIRREIAPESGAKPVRYYSHDEKVRIPDEEKWLWQSQGIKSDWRTENEWRCLGDFALDKIHPEDLILFCRTENEKEQLSGKFGIRTVAFEKAI